jgi:hypothetical protein
MSFLLLFAITNSFPLSLPQPAGGVVIAVEFAVVVLYARIEAATLNARFDAVATHFLSSPSDSPISFFASSSSARR